MKPLKNTIKDKTLDQILEQAPNKKQTHHVREGSFTGAIANSINPYFLITGMSEELYEQFNKHPKKTIQSMYLEVDEPLAISKQLMNGAESKLLNQESPDYLPSKKAQYHIAHQDKSIPAVSFLPANGTYNAALFNQRDWADF